MQHTIAGKALHCPHCGGENFEEGKAQLNTAALSFLGMEWLNPTARTFACQGYGRLEWFLSGRGDANENTSEASDCLSCGKSMPAGTDRCPSCGWSYNS